METQLLSENNTALTNHLSYLSVIIEVKTTNGCFYFEYWDVQIVKNNPGIFFYQTREHEI